MKIRAIMIGIVLMALIAWPVSTAHRVLQDRDRTAWHLAIQRDSGSISLSGHSVPFHFGSRFRDALIGRQWPGDHFHCDCGIHDDPNRIVVASASRNEALLQQQDELAKPHQRAVELAIELDSHEKTIEHDQAAIDQIDRQLAWAARNGTTIHGAEGVRKVYQQGIDQRRAAIPGLRALLSKYRSAALHPWDPIEPDPPAASTRDNRSPVDTRPTRAGR